MSGAKANVSWSRIIRAGDGSVLEQKSPMLTDENGDEVGWDQPEVVKDTREK